MSQVVSRSFLIHSNVSRIDFPLVKVAQSQMVISIPILKKDVQNHYP